MASGHPRALILAPAAVVRQLDSVLAEDVASGGAETFEEAVLKLGEVEPELLIVCYVFDEVRPFRVINYVRQAWRGRRVPIILVRALPVPLGHTEEAAVRESYTRLGVDEFFNLYSETQRIGWQAAARHFRDRVVGLLPVRREEFAAPREKRS